MKAEMRQIIAGLFLLAGIAASSVAGATVINGQIANFDGDRDGMADDLKISRVTFNVTAGTRVFFDSMVYESDFASLKDLNGDGQITGFDSYMMLFDAAGTNLFYADDSNATFGDGSVNTMDAARSWTFSQAGTYMITIGQGTSFQHEALQGFEKNTSLEQFIGEQNFAAWRLTMSATGGTLSQVAEVGVPAADVPEPASLLLLGAGLAGFAASRRKKNPSA